MAVISSGGVDPEVIFLRNAVLRMLVTRACIFLSGFEDKEQLEIAGIVGELTLDSVDADQRPRLVSALLAGAEQRLREIWTGVTPEEEVRPGIEGKLDEVQVFLRTHRT